MENRKDCDGTPLRIGDRVKRVFGNGGGGMRADDEGTVAGFSADPHELLSVRLKEYPKGYHIAERLKLIQRGEPDLDEPPAPDLDLIVELLEEFGAHAQQDGAVLTSAEAVEQAVLLENYINYHRNGNETDK